MYPIIYADGNKLSVSVASASSVSAVLLMRLVTTVGGDNETAFSEGDSVEFSWDKSWAITTTGTELVVLISQRRFESTS